MEAKNGYAQEAQSRAQSAKLSIILSTRGRPHLLVPTVRTTLKNVRNPNTRLIVMADEDDTDTILTRPQIEKMGATMWPRPRAMSLGEKFNAGMQVEPGDVYLVMVDYAPHVTEGFDQKILDAASIYPDGYAAVYNWWANLSFPQINAVTARLAAKMGGIYPALYPYWWVDHHLDDVARMIGRIVFADVHIDTSARKDTPGKAWTQGKRDTWLWALLFDALATERQEIARSIIESVDFDETPARKRALLNNFPWITHHSACVNSGARQDAGENLPPDDWYEAVKATGLAKLRSVLTPEQWGEVEALQERLKGQKAA
jgi:hypothetical protein